MATYKQKLAAQKLVENGGNIDKVMVAAGIGLFAYVYLRSKNLHETISDLLRKRN